MESIKIGNTEIICKLNLDKFNRSNMIIKHNDVVKFDIMVTDYEMINSLRALYLIRNVNINYSELLDFLNNYIGSNNLL